MTDEAKTRDTTSAESPQGQARATAGKYVVGYTNGDLITIIGGVDDPKLYTADNQRGARQAAVNDTTQVELRELVGLDTKDPRTSGVVVLAIPAGSWRPTPVRVERPAPRVIV